jgi:hypothetical protein
MVVALACGQANGKDGSGQTAKTAIHLTPPIMLPWSPRKDFGDVDANEDLQVEVLPGFEAILHVYKGKRLIFRFRPGIQLFRVFLLDDGNLATIWTGAGGSHFRLIVFGYSHGKVLQVLSTLSDGLMPEFAYLTDGHILVSTEVDKKGIRHLVGHSLQHSIIVPNVKWIESASGGEELPVSADIFTWNEKTGNYDVRKNVSWDKRFRKIGR